MMATSSNAAFMPHLHQYPSQPTYSQYQEQQNQSQYYNHHHHQMQSNNHQHHPSSSSSSSWNASIPRGNQSFASTSTNMQSNPVSTTQSLSLNTSMKATGTGKKRKRLQRACVACHKAKRRCDGGLPCSNCDFSGRTCAYSDSQGKAVPPTKRTLRPSEAALQEQKMMQQQHQTGSAPISSSSTSQQSISPLSAYPQYSLSNDSSSNPERWTEQLDLAWSAIHTFADATSTMMNQQESSEAALPLTVAHNLAVILERMNEQHALLTEHMTAMGVAMLKKSCSSAYQSATSHQDHHAWSDLERRSEKLQGLMRMDNERLNETQKWISKGNESKKDSFNGNNSRNRVNNNSSSRQRFERTSWSASPPIHPIRSSLSPIQSSTQLFSSNNNNNANNYDGSKLKSRHNSTSSTATSGSIMTIGNSAPPSQTYAQLQDPSSTGIPFLPPLTGLTNLKNKDSHTPTLPPLRRFPSPTESNKRSIFVEY